tara:strand:+ start:70740 stop:72128 length:1389 start_codon:yes stop_codon:yes gene_type:complete
MRLLITIAVLLLGSISVHAEFPTKQYGMGFETVTVFEYKKILREANEEIPVFPPRTETAVIVRLVESESRASMAGLKENDLIRIINGSYLQSPKAADEKLKMITNQDLLDLGVIRRVDGAWNQVSIVLKPITDKEALKLSLSKVSSIDGSFKPYVKVRHRNTPFTNFAPNNIQLYYTERSSRPDALHMKIAQLIPGQSQPGRFVITVETDKYTFEPEGIQPNRPGLFFPGSLRSPQWEPVKIEILLIQSDDGLKKIKEEFKLAEETYDREFKGFKFDKDRKDKAYQQRNQQRLALITSMERINAKIISSEKNHQRLLQHKERLSNRLNLPGSNHIKLTEQARAAIKAQFLGLTSGQKELVKRVFTMGFLPSSLKEEELLQLEETGLADQEIKNRHAKQGWNWIDVPLNPQRLAMIKKIISAKTVTVYHENAPEQKFEVTPEQKAQMQTVLAVFEAEGGKVGE